MVATHAITAIFTQEEYELLEAFAAEQGIEKLEEAIPAMLHELVKLYDQQWDASFAESTEPFDRMAKEALKQHRQQAIRHPKFT